MRRHYGVVSRSWQDSVEVYCGVGVGMKIVRGFDSDDSRQEIVFPIHVLITYYDGDWKLEVADC